MDSGSEAISLHWSDHARRLQLDFLAPSRDDYYICSYQVRVKSRSMNAATTVIASTESGGDGLAKFMHGLAQDFRGWEGVRTWRSIEDQLLVAATWATGGHVELMLRIKPSIYDKWELATSFDIEAGEEMANLAASIEAFFHPFD